MKRNILLLTVLLFLMACGRQHKQVVKPLRFYTDVCLRTTPVKNQGTSSLCWAYAMLATIETEHIMKGDSINLSIDYVARSFLKEQALEACLLRHKQDASLTTRGMMPMTIRLIQTYGLTHYDAYHRRDNVNFYVLTRQLRLAINGASSVADCNRQTDQLLDKALGSFSNHVFLFGAQYTPLEFAHSVCRDDEYEAMTSFSHHPFGKRFPLEVADNLYHDNYLNVPIDTLMKTIVEHVKRGHPVCWEGDISENGFSFEQGVAVLDNEQTNITQELRQQAFENHETTDDHCMEIVGLAHDQNGRRYFIMKNSWGTGNPFGGFMYVSYNYVKLKTIAIVASADITQTIDKQHKK